MINTHAKLPQPTLGHQRSGSLAYPRAVPVKDLRAVALLNIGLILVLFAFPKAMIFDFVWIAYMVQLVFGLAVLYSGSDKRLSNLFSPSVITFIYFGLSFSLGSYCVFHGITLRRTAMTPDGSVFRNSIYLVVFMTMMGQTLLLTAALKGTLDTARRFANLVTPEKAAEIRRQSADQTVALIALTVFVIFSFLPFSLSFLGGSGSFSFSLRLASAIALFAASLRLPNVMRMGFAITIVAASAIQSYHSKREIIFVLIAALMIEVVWRGWKARFTVKQISTAVAFVALFVVLILWSSILRGYGNYRVKSPVDAFRYIPTYVNESYFLAAANENFELAHVFGNTANCINLAYNGSIPYLYGSTFVKVFFAPIPRSMFPQKPRSMIDVYTMRVAPGFHAKGGSIPVTLFGELFANFHVLGLILVYPIFRVLDRIYLAFETLLFLGKFTTKFYLAAFLSATTIQYSRGSGLEIHLIYAVVALPLMYCFFHIGRRK